MYLISNSCSLYFPSAYSALTDTAVTSLRVVLSGPGAPVRRAAFSVWVKRSPVRTTGDLEHQLRQGASLRFS